MQLGASYGSEVDAAIGAGRILVEADQTHVARMRKLLHGRVDAAFLGNGRLGLKALLESDPELAAHQARFVILERPLVRDALYLGFAKSMNKRTLLAEFDRALQAARSQKRLSGLIDSAAHPETRTPSGSANKNAEALACLRVGVFAVRDQCLRRITLPIE